MDHQVQQEHVTQVPLVEIPHILVRKASIIQKVISISALLFELLSSLVKLSLVVKASIIQNIINITALLFELERHL
jgi:hypothetical protein